MMDDDSINNANMHDIFQRYRLVRENHQTQVDHKFYGLWFLSHWERYHVNQLNATVVSDHDN